MLALIKPSSIRIPKCEDEPLLEKAAAMRECTSMMASDGEKVSSMKTIVRMISSV